MGSLGSLVLSEGVLPALARTLKCGPQGLANRRIPTRPCISSTKLADRNFFSNRAGSDSCSHCWLPP